MITLNADSHFAHRGLHDESKPKNSLAAIVTAADAGYGVEFDVQLSADGVPIISHDPDTQADTGVHMVIAKTHSEVLRQLRFAGSSETLATLDDVVSAVGARVPLLVEIKPTTRVGATVSAVATRLQGREPSTALQSFQPSIVTTAKRRFGQFAVGQLGEQANSTMPMLQRVHTRLLATNWTAKPDFLAMYLPVLQSPMVRFWRSALGCALLGWTVIDDNDMVTCRDAGAGMIFEKVRP